MRQFFVLIIVSLALVSCGGSEGESKSVTFESSIAGLDHKPGFFDLYLDETRVLAVLPAPDDDGLVLSAIYATGLTAGLGSNPIGLDRGAFDSGIVLNFRYLGGKLIAEEENIRYRASADRALEKKAVEQSFARSFLWSGEIIARDGSGRLLVDLSSFLTRDHFGVVAQIAGNPDGGTYQIAADRSFPDPSAALAFPDNVELDAFLTLGSTAPGREVRATAADGRDVTLIQHHSFIRLPDPGYTTRPADQRSGAIEVAYYDFSSALDEPIVNRLARRFRLERVDPALSSGPVKKPIVFYVDPGAPKQIQDALIEGASWWADAFTAAGFEDAYRVELLPEDAHPFDVRYNMIQWTHRQTRGWSYGGGVFDPRTGEMLKANVILGSQRVRQDRMIFEGLAGAEKSGSGEPDDPVQIALARIRQLSAHEVGHTLGFAHNFAASSNDRASVMDYPAPYIRPNADGTLDFSQAYASGVGPWDVFATKWLYSEFPEGTDSAAALQALVSEAYGEQGLRFVADSEARSLATAHPYGAVWDNGEDAIAALEETMQVREIALENFGPRSLLDGQPLSDLQTVLVPIYLYHRYQVAAAAKYVGGLQFDYGLKGNGGPASPVPFSDQQRAFQALLSTLDPIALDLPDSLINQLVPPINGGRGGEDFDGRTGPVFDVLSSADIAANLTISALLHPERAARLVAFKRRDPAAFGFDDMLVAMEIELFSPRWLSSPAFLPRRDLQRGDPLLPPSASREQAIADVVQTRFATALMALSVHPDASPAVRSASAARLESIQARLSRAGTDHARWLGDRIAAHMARPADALMEVAPRTETPPGSPIGSGPQYETCWHCE